MSNSSFLIITSAIGTKVSGASTGMGAKNPDGTYNVTGTILGTAQTAHSLIDFSAGAKWTSLGGAAAKTLPGIGMALSAAGIYASFDAISGSRARNKPISQSDIAGVIGNTAGFVGGALLFIAGTAVSPGVLIGLTVVAVGAGIYQIVASASGWTAGGQAVALTPQQQIYAEILTRNAVESSTGKEALFQAGVPADAKVQVGGSVFANPNTTTAITSPAGLGTTRDSSAFVTDNGVESHTVTLGKDGTLSDILYLQNKAGNGITAADIVACNPDITDPNQVKAGQILYIPQKQTDGVISYPFANGTTVNSNPTTGEYNMQIPAAEGVGGHITYIKEKSSDGNYSLREIQTDKAGNITQDFTAGQNAVTGDIQGSSRVTRLDNDGDGKIDRTVSDTLSADGIETNEEKILNGDGTVASATATIISADKKNTVIEADKNGDGKWDSMNIGLDLNTDGVLETVISPGDSLNSILDADKQVHSLYQLGQLGSGTWGIYADWSTTQLVNMTFTTPSSVTTPTYVAPDLSPIGAFYESKSAALDLAQSISNRTFRIVDSASVAVTATQLIALDSNKDGKLNATELTGLSAWSDLNEDGVLN